MLWKWCLKLVLDKPQSWFWVCKRKPWGKPRRITFKFSVRRGTVLENSHLSIDRLFRLLFHFSQGHQPKEVSANTGMHDAIKRWMELGGVQSLQPMQQATVSLVQNQVVCKGGHCLIFPCCTNAHPGHIAHKIRFITRVLNSFCPSSENTSKLLSCLPRAFHKYFSGFILQ